MAKRNHHLTTVPDYCQVCGEIQGYIQALTPKFKSNKRHSTGMCPKCREKIDKMTEKLMAGGILTQCTECEAVNVFMLEELPHIAQAQVTTNVDGSKHLLMKGCPLCEKGVSDAGK